MRGDGGPTLAAALVDFPCDLCGSESLRVVRPARYSGQESLDDVLADFRSSAEKPLHDRLSECRQCGLIFVSPRLPEELIVQGYADAVDPRHLAQAAAREASFGRALDGLLARHRWLRPTGATPLLDIGCAGGSFLAAARERGFAVRGIEPSAWLAEQGRAHYGLQIDAGLFDADRYGEGSFDVVTLWDVLEHVSSPRELLAGIHRVLRPGGALIINVPTIDSVTARVLRGRWPFYLGVHLYYFTTSSLTRYLVETGFAPMGHRAYWQTLPLGYVVERGSGGRVGQSALPSFLGDVPFRYNMGQRTFVARRS